MAVELPDARHLSDESIRALRLRALHGLELCYAQLELAQLLGVTNETIGRRSTAYEAQGLNALPGNRSGRPLGSGRPLTEQQAQFVRERIGRGPPGHSGLPHALWTRRAVRELIRKEFNVDSAERTVGQYLCRRGYTSKKPTRRAKAQDPDEAEQWLEDVRPAIEAQAVQESAEILWADQVGVAADRRPGCGYARRGEPAVVEVPGPHVRVNQVPAISDEGTVRFMTYKGSLDAAVFLLFLGRLIAATPRTVLLIADGLGARKTPAVQAWVEAHRDRIALFYPPAYLAGDGPGGVPEQRHEGGRQRGRVAAGSTDAAGPDAVVHEAVGGGAKPRHWLFSSYMDPICHPR